jgi:hopanoid biosynthesis associated radical SAM protein HpnH
MRETHDRLCGRPGVFDRATRMIREARALGYDVVTNTTVYRETDMAEVDALCAYLTRLGVNGMLIAPGYHYETAEQEIFLTRSEMHEKFRRVIDLSRKYRLLSTPAFLELAAGLRDLPCSPWSTVTFTPRGWKNPCYLVGRRLTFDWGDFWNNTDWRYWESRQDEACRCCAMHSGFEASAVLELSRSAKDLAGAAVWTFS